MYVVGANDAPSSPEYDRWHTTTQEAFMNHGQTLVVDDDPNIRLLLTATLEFEGLEVQMAPDDATALELCATRPFALFLIDYLLPGMDGLALARAIRGQHPELPIALITGSAHLLSEADLAAMGITRLFPKPFDLDELVTWIRTHLP
jgi:DNA-binding response OmpR family regulator